MSRIIELTPTVELELVLATVSLNPSMQHRIFEILGGTLDWSQVLRIALQQGILPLFLKRLMLLVEKQTPPGDLTLWSEAFKANTQSNIRLTWKLVECVELLSTNGIDCIILKGPALAVQAYGDLSLRQFSDLDILIHSIDFPKVYDLLVHNGYAPTFKLEKNQKKYVVWSNNHFSFNRLGDIIEVHWEIAPYENIHPLSSEEMWQNLDSIQIFDTNFSTLSLKNTILYTCLHGAKHGWKQLKWIVDLAYLCRSLSESALLDLLEHAKRKGLFRQVCLGLLLAENLVDTKFPSECLKHISADSYTQLLVSQVKAGLFAISNKPSIIKDYLFYLKSRERWQDRLYYLYALIIIPKQPDWLMISLPENLYFLYCFIRPIRLLYIGGKAAISALN